MGFGSFGAQIGPATLSWKRQHVVSKSSKGERRQRSELLPIHKKTLSDSHVYVEHGVFCKEIHPSPASKGSDNDTTPQPAQLEAKTELLILPSRTESLFFDQTPMAYAQDAVAIIPPDSLSCLTLPNLDQHAIFKPDTDRVLNSLDNDFPDAGLVDMSLSSLTKDLDMHKDIATKIPSRSIPPRPPPKALTPNTTDTPLRINPSGAPPPEPRIEVQEPYNKEWDKIKRLRAEVRRLRSRAHQMRKVLRDKQQARSEADDKYFQLVRMRKLQPSSENPSHQDEIFQKLFEDCQRLRDDCGPLEDDCIMLDNDLSYHEFELEKLEDRFYKRPIEPPVSRTSVMANTHEFSPASSTYGGSEMDQQEYHPLVYQYLSKKGDINNLNDRLDWHEDEKRHLEEEKELRKRVGLSLAEKGQKWLDDYSQLEEDLLQLIEQAEDEAEILREKCFAEGLIDEDGEPTDFETRERQTFINDKPLNPGTAKSAFVNFPTLLPQPSGKQEEFHDPGLDPDAPAVDPRDRINGWLLHQLRMSPLEVNRLAFTYESKYGDIQEGEVWEINVLEWWYRDGAKEGTGKSGRTISSVSSGEVTEKSANAVDKL